MHKHDELVLVLVIFPSSAPFFVFFFSSSPSPSSSLSFPLRLSVSFLFCFSFSLSLFPSLPPRFFFLFPLLLEKKSTYTLQTLRLTTPHVFATRARDSPLLFLR